ncbi:MAG: crotonase/enoyl-CoA hydratase family protein [Pseudomonadota bacterium]
MSYQCFDVSIEDGVAHVTMNRPQKRNSMIAEFWDELPALVADIDLNARARVIVLSSTGPHFTAGIDLGMFGTSVAAKDESAEHAARVHGARFYANVKNMQRAFSVLEDARIPVLAAIQGGCIGGGMDLVTACDMRYVSADAFFSVEETNIGMTADVGTFPRLAKLIPEGLVKELCYTGARMPASEAHRIGLVNRVFDDHDALIKGVMDIARTIAQKAPLAVSGCKKMINYARDHSTADALDYVSIWNASMLQHGEIEEAITARAEKRIGEFVELPVVKDRVG